MTRTMLIAVGLLALVYGAGPSRAEEQGPWCAVYSVGGGNTRQDCHWRTLPECQQSVIAGDRGFCIENPRYAGPAKKPGKPN